MNEKFLSRGKRKDNGEWVEGYAAQSGGTFILCDNGLTYGGFEMFEVDPETAGRYTGLTDKNGKKIFEVDIVEYDNQFFEIRYIDGFATFDCRDPYSMKYAPRITPNTIARMTVRGNIHDNPELLGDIDKPVAKTAAQPVLKPATEPPVNFQLMNA